MCAASVRASADGDVDDVEPQHLSVKRLIDDALDDLQAVGPPGSPLSICRSLPSTTRTTTAAPPATGIVASKSSA